MIGIRIPPILGRGLHFRNGQVLGWYQEPQCCRESTVIVLWQAGSTPTNFVHASTLTSSMPVPAIGKMTSDFHIMNERLGTLSVSIFILGVGVGPLLFGSFAEQSTMSCY